MISSRLLRNAMFFRKSGTMQLDMLVRGNGQPRSPLSLSDFLGAWPFGRQAARCPSGTIVRRVGVTRQAPKARSARLLQIGSIAFVVAAFLSCVYPVGSVLAGTYEPCRLPVVIGSSVRPNMMIVQDMSGSMQFATDYPFATANNWGGYYGNSNIVYQNPRECLLSGTTAYTITNSSYGYWDSDTYYVYDPTTQDAAGSVGFWKNPLESIPAESYTPPVSKVQFTAPSADGGGGTDSVHRGRPRFVRGRYGRVLWSHRPHKHEWERIHGDVR